MNTEQKIKVIVNRNQSVSVIGKAYVTTSKANLFILKALKNNAAKKLIDTEDTLMYEITINN